MTRIIYKNRVYARITTPNGKHHVWIRRPERGQIVCCFSFSLSGQMPFVDAVDKLEYVEVQEVKNIDPDLSYLYLECIGNSYRKANEALLEDLPNIMERYNIGEA